MHLERLKKKKQEIQGGLECIFYGIICETAPSLV